MLHLLRGESRKEIHILPLTDLHSMSHASKFVLSNTPVTLYCDGTELAVPFNFLQKEALPSLPELSSHGATTTKCAYDDVCNNI